jgi:glycosyltransferase involved in cell wall biosynthesis
LAVLFHRLGPYHHARLQALAGELPIVAIEFSSVDATYAWKPVTPSGAFPVRTLFTHSDVLVERFDKTKETLGSVLGEVNPAAVAIPGWSARPALLALGWCERRGVPAILMSESQERDGRRHAGTEFFKRCVVKRYSAALVGGQAHRLYLERLGLPPSRVHLGYDVVDNDHFAAGAEAARRADRAVRASLGLPERYFLASSRFIPKKNLERLLEAYASYRAGAGADAWKLVLLGDGEARPGILGLRRQLGVEDDVLLPGFKQYEELPAYYGLASAFVHASTVEQWGLVVNEAMAAGLPVIVSRQCGCATDLVQEGRNGYVFDAHRSEELADLLRRVSRDEAQLAAMGLASRTIIAEWGPERFARGMAAAVDVAMMQGVSVAGVLERLVLEALAHR